ncbi:MAG: glycosyltransferase, partial [Myxococcales bacterium]|nr:glycosyltransferase [Myxococcales bacterium]
MSEPRPLIIIPTYNERENLPELLDRVLAALPVAHILIVDDGSPDGTGQLADERAAADPRVHVLHREGKLGLGTAYIAGFKWGLAREYTHLFEMDADFS